MRNFFTLMSCYLFQIRNIKIIVCADDKLISNILRLKTHTTSTLFHASNLRRKSNAREYRCIVLIKNHFRELIKYFFYFLYLNDKVFNKSDKTNLQHLILPLSKCDHNSLKIMISIPRLKY